MMSGEITEFVEESLAKALCASHCRDFGNLAALKGLVQDNWRDWLPQARDLQDKLEIIQGLEDEIHWYGMAFECAENERDNLLTLRGQLDSVLYALLHRRLPGQPIWLFLRKHLEGWPQ